MTLSLSSLSHHCHDLLTFFYLQHALALLHGDEFLQVRIQFPIRNNELYSVE